MTNKQVSTFDRLMSNPKTKKAFDKQHKEFLISELLIALMENDHKSVRELAKAAELSPATIQKMRSGKTDMKLGNFFKVIQILGYEVVLKKGSKYMPLPVTV
jgi:transcriptional regulator with XRE-family HTH domain